MLTIQIQLVNKMLMQFTLCPTLVSQTGEPAGGPAGAIAYAINSVKFDPATAGGVMMTAVRFSTRTR